MAPSVSFAVALVAISVASFFILPRHTNLCLDPLLPCTVSEGGVSAGEVVLITGGSAGIGEELALLYARRGAHLVLTARRADALREVAQRCESAGAQSVVSVPGDARWTAAELAALLHERHSGSLDVLVLNHAAIPLKLFQESESVSDLDDVLSTNFIASANITHSLLPLLEGSSIRSGRRGRIAIVGSSGSFFYPGFLSAYIASKAALAAFFASLRVELAVAGRPAAPSITQLHLGEIATQHHLDSTMEGASAAPHQMTPEACAEGIARAIDRRLVEAFVPSSMWAISWLGGFHSLRPFFFKVGFLGPRPWLQERVDELRERLSRTSR